MSHKTVLFTARHGLLDGFIAGAANRAPTYFFYPDNRELVEVGAATPITVTCKTFGLGYLFGLFRLETLTPSYIKNFNERVKGRNIGTIITLDFFRFLFVQALLYKKNHPDVRLFVYSETQRWPQNTISRLAMWLFWQFFELNIKHVDEIFVFTEQGRDFFESRLRGKISVVLVPAPVDTERFYPDSEKQFMKDGMLRILMNARFVKYKNHKDLLEALKIAKGQGLKFELTLIGRGGQLKGEVLKCVSRSGIGEFVRHREAVTHEQMRDMYVAHDVLVLPSYNEAIGMVVPEAMSCGIPTITSDTVGANVYVKDGETGLIFKTGKVGELAEKLQKINNQELLRRYGTEARRHVEENYSIDFIQKQFQDTLGL